MSADRREIMEALGDKTRYSILQSLMNKPMTGDEIAEAAQRSRSTVESHLAMLLRLELVSRRLDDRTYYYEATPLARNWMDQVNAPQRATDTPDAMAEISRVQTKAKPEWIKLAWLWLPIVFGAAFVGFNAAGIPLSIFMAALAYGLISSLLIGRIQEMFVSVIIASASIALFTYAFIITSSSAFLIAFMYSLLYLGLGMMVWFIVRIMRRLVRRQ